MQINTVESASRQQLQDEVLALIRSRTSAEPASRAASPAKAEKAAEPVGPAQTVRAVHEINRALKILSTSLRFEVDEESGKTIVKVIDRDNGEILRRIPSETAVQIAKSMDRLAGHLVNQAT